MTADTALIAGLKAAVRRHMTGADPAHDIGHLARVWENAKAIADVEGGDLRVLAGAAFLHDLVNLPKSDPDRAMASTRSAEAAVPILESLGFSGVEIDATAHAIRAHSFSAGIAPETIEARVLQDADRLDALGAVGIARMFTVSGGLDRAIADADDPFATARELDDGRFALDHFAVKLLRLEAAMSTVTGRKLAATRTARMRAFVQAFGEEVGLAYTEGW